MFYIIISYFTILFFIDVNSSINNQKLLIKYVQYVLNSEIYEVYIINLCKLKVKEIIKIIKGEKLLLNKNIIKIE